MATTLRVRRADAASSARDQRAMPQWIAELGDLRHDENVDKDVVG